jgi:hypothetical protein
VWQLKRPTLRNHWVLPMAVPLAALSCGYGFGNHEFGRQRSTALAFAQTLQAGDTARMRSLSAPEAWGGLAALARQVPPAYLGFTRPTPDLTTREGGGIYSGKFAVFLIHSTPLQSCNGGVQVTVATLTDRPQVITLRLVPAPDSLTDAACHRAVLGTADHGGTTS